MTEFKVSDLGPIGKASIELKPLTVFVGPNNSGKSYLALALYCLSRTLGRRQIFESLTRTPVAAYLGELPNPALLQRAKADIRETWPTRHSFFEGSPARVGDLPQGLQEAFSVMSRALGEGLATFLGPEIQRVYGTNIERLQRRSPALGPSHLSIEVGHQGNEFSWKTQVMGGTLTTEAWNHRISDKGLDPRIFRLPARMIEDDFEYFLMDLLAYEQDLFIPSDLIPRAHYMPASRSSILLGHKAFSSLLVDQSSRAWIRSIEIPRLPGFVTDLIQSLLLMNSNDRERKPLDKIIRFLEENITHGTIDLDDTSEYPDVFFSSEVGKFQLHEASSMVSEIAPIVLYLKHVVRAGDLFIVEEPESHVDAANQRRFASAIAMLVNAGVHVLITTHSDYLVSQLGNLVMLSNLSTRRRAARRYTAAQVLRPEQVSAYMFEPTADGTNVHALEVDAEQGIPLGSFTSVHAQIYDEALALER